MSTAWQGNVLIGIGSAVFVAGVGAFVAKDPAPMTPIVAMLLSGLTLSLVGIIYVRKADEWQEQRKRKRTAEQWKKMGKALSGPITEKYLESELHDPWGNEIPEVRKALDEFRAQKSTTSTSPQSPQPPKRGR